ncbi:MAG TPA: peptidase A24 [Methanosarcinales archaeon]|nr:peptidase A24 [Methanosarcinales archaeon]
MIPLDLLKVVICTPFLIYSCYSDLKIRKVSNQLWLIMISVGVPYVIYEYVYYHYGIQYLLRYLVSVLFIYVFVYFLFRLSAFGGADAKALITLSIIFPKFPEIDVFGYQFPITGVPILDLFAFSILGNAVILPIFLPFVLFIYNLVNLSIEEIRQKPLYLFFAFKKDINKLQGHIKLIEEYKQIDGRVQARFKWGMNEITSDVIKELKDFEAKGLIEQKVWVTYKLPFMIPITAGFFTAVIFGDLIFFILNIIFK